MAEKRQSYDAEFREGAVRIVTETGKTIAQVAADPGIKETTLGSWVARTRRAGGDGTLGERSSQRRDVTGVAATCRSGRSEVAVQELPYLGDGHGPRAVRHRLSLLQQDV